MGDAQPCFFLAAEIQDVTFPRHVVRLLGDVTLKGVLHFEDHSWDVGPVDLILELVLEGERAVGQEVWLLFLRCHEEQLVEGYLPRDVACDPEVGVGGEAVKPGSGEGGVGGVGSGVGG